LVGSASPHPSLLYRFLRRLFGLMLAVLFRVRVTGVENLPRTAAGRPAGGWIACGLPHRTWVEFFVLLVLLPAEPRLIMLGEGPTIFGAAWRRALMHRVGGVVPIWRGSGASGFEAHVEAAEQAVRAGSVFGLFPEVGRATRPPALRRVSAGVAYFSLRTGASLVPIIFGGTHELYLRRTIEVRILPPIEPPKPPPSPGTPDERAAAEDLVTRLRAVAEPAVAAAQQSAEPPPGARKLARWLTGTYPQPD
jgi:1-acyl-sn-glycerol-3-phosphate acyltransferase